MEWQWNLIKVTHYNNITIRSPSFWQLYYYYYYFFQLIGCNPIIWFVIWQFFATKKRLVWTFKLQVTKESSTITTWMIHFVWYTLSNFWKIIIKLIVLNNLVINVGLTFYVPSLQLGTGMLKYPTFQGVIQRTWWNQYTFAHNLKLMDYLVVSYVFNHFFSYQVTINLVKSIGRSFPCFRTLLNFV